MYEILKTILIKFIKILPVLSKLLVYMSDDWKNARTDMEVETMTKYAKLGRLLSIITIAPSLTTSAFQVPSTISMTKQQIAMLRMEANGTEIVKPLFFRAYYFFDVQKSPIYEIYWGLQASSTVIGGAYFAAIDALFAVLVLHLCGQLTNLKQVIIDLPNQKANGKKSFEKLVSEVVARHQHLAK